MARNTSFTCDRCGYTQPKDRKFPEPENPRWFNTVGVCVQTGDTRLGTREWQREKAIEVLWCETCCDAVGLGRLARFTGPKPGEPPTPTLEEIIRQVVRDEIERAQP